MKAWKEDNMHFDLILANPPYDYGNEITKTIINNLDFDDADFINLMPNSKYKSGNLYQYIRGTMTALEEGSFEDASTSPQIATLSRTRVARSKEEFDLMTYDPRFERIYKHNMENKDVFIEGHHSKVKYARVAEWGINPDTWFAYQEHQAYLGVPVSTDSIDAKWNLFKDASCIPYNKWDNERGQMFFLWMKFNTAEEKNNFTNWFYSKQDRTGLAHKLVKGLRKRDSSCEAAFPQIDWSRPWTDIEILEYFNYSAEDIEEILK